MTVEVAAEDVADNWWPVGFQTERDADIMSTVDDEGIRRDVHIYVGGLRDRRGGPQGKPQAFLVHMQPGDRVGAHFHRIDQYQVFFGAAGGLFQRSPLPPRTVTLQYADAYSTYGPFSAGEEMLEFFTLRAAGDGVVAYMPGSRERLVHRGRRLMQTTFDIGEKLQDREVRIEHVFGPDEDAMVCYRIRGGRGASTHGPDVGGKGQFYCVIAGTARWSGRTFGPKSLAWVRPDGAPLSLGACGGDGFDVLVMQYPDPPSFPVPDEILTGVRAE